MEFINRKAWGKLFNLAQNSAQKGKNINRIKIVNEPKCLFKSSTIIGFKWNAKNSNV